MSYCKGHCGSTSPINPPGCYCDEQCVASKDCCSDYGPACNPVSGPGVVECGTGKCTPPNQFCCQQFISGGALAPKCQAPNTQCIGPDVWCDGPDDCPTGKVCCSTVVGGSSLLVECRDATDCKNGDQTIFCGNDPSVCADGEKCVPHPWVPAYNYCQ